VIRALVDERDPVTLTLAAEGRYARVARTVVASCAALVGFSIDDLIDVRLVTDMAFNALRELGEGEILIAVRTDPGALAIEMSASRGSTRGWDDPDVRMLAMITAVVALESEFVEVADRLVLRVAMRAGGPAVT
jgi:hypothetical protein